MLNKIEDAIEEIRKGKVIIVVDDEDRENEGDFVTAARNATPEIVNFMATHGRGLICTPISQERCDELQLSLMVSKIPRITKPLLPFLLICLDMDVLQGFLPMIGLKQFRRLLIRIQNQKTLEDQDIFSRFVRKMAAYSNVPDIPKLL